MGKQPSCHGTDGTSGNSKQLQNVTGNCKITLPYWDWERDYLNKNTSSALRWNTFGSVLGANKTGGDCVIEGVAKYTQTLLLSNGTTVLPWAKTVRTQKCLRRTFASSYTFSSDLDILNRILNNANYTRFRPSMEGAHAGPHNFINGHMATMHSSDDPLFFLHHANADRMWAIWEDYNNIDLFDPSAYTAAHYNLSEIDIRLIYNNASILNFTIDGVNTPRPRDLLKSYNGLVNVTYANDYLAKLLIEVTAASRDVDYSGTNNPKWVQPATDSVPTRCATPCLPLGSSCSSDLTPCCSGRCTNGKCSAVRRRFLKKPDSPPGFSNPKAQGRFKQLVDGNPGKKKADIICQLAHEDCEERGNPVTASPEWIHAMGLDEDSGLFNCHQKCKDNI